MVYRVGERRFRVVSSLLCGRVNDVHICCEEDGLGEVYYTLLDIKDHRTARQVVSLSVGEAQRKIPYLEAFAWGDRYCLLFEYRRPRPVSRFWETVTGMGESPALEIVVRCMEESRLCYPVLYLILKQNQVNIGAEGEIYFTFCLDLEELESRVVEGRCACACAELLAGLLGRQGGRSLELICRKAGRNAYRNFGELCRDLKLTAPEERRPGVPARIRAWAHRNRDRGFWLLLILCAALAILAAATLASQTFTGEVGWFRLLFHTFDQIGTESLR